MLYWKWWCRSLSSLSLSPRSPRFQDDSLRSWSHSLCRLIENGFADAARLDAQDLKKEPRRTLEGKRCFSHRHSCPLAGSSDYEGVPAEEWSSVFTSSHLKCPLSCPVSFFPGRLADWILFHRHIKDSYKRRQKENKCARARHVFVEHFQESYFARLHLPVAAHRSVKLTHASRLPSTSLTQTFTCFTNKCGIKLTFKACFPRWHSMVYIFRGVRCHFMAILFGSLWIYKARPIHSLYISNRSIYTYFTMAHFANEGLPELAVYGVHT